MLARLLRCIVHWLRYGPPVDWSPPLDPESDWRWQQRHGGSWGLESGRREDESMCVDIGGLIVQHFDPDDRPTLTTTPISDAYRWRPGDPL